MGVVSAKPLRLLEAAKGEAVDRLHCARRSESIARETGCNRMLREGCVMLTIRDRPEETFTCAFRADVRLA